jgi:deoxyribodipyrimidine photo-lyase
MFPSTFERKNIMKQERIRMLKNGERKNGPVLYWMSRDQRAQDNWALHYAQEMSLRSKVPLGVVFCLVPEFLEACIRQYGFMLKGLQETEEYLKEKKISFLLLEGLPFNTLPKFAHEHKISALVTDFDPLRIKTEWKRKVAKQIDVPFFEVDAHNIIPCWHASPKQEFAAYTFRPKIKRILDDFLEPFPRLKKHSIPWKAKHAATNWAVVLKSLKVNREVEEIEWIKPGEKEGKKILKYFVKNKLSNYEKSKNDPNKDAPSDLSPYLHFGQISAQRIALEVLKAGPQDQNRDAFLEELIIRRELADNYCYYNVDYDNFQGFPDWAKKTLNEHRKDKREHMYTYEQFEKGETHDALWNAAQKQMVKAGKMHGYMRMYWAKKILEWTDSPKQAQKIAIDLNDKYSLDGRDPNGYTGIAWSIGGVHDRAWFNRPIFGKIRFMSAKGAQSKFDVKSYIMKMERL